MRQHVITATENPDHSVTVEQHITGRPGDAEDVHSSATYTWNGTDGFGVYTAWQAAAMSCHAVALDNLHRELDSIEHQMRDVVRLARQDGVSWSTIGAGLGISRQAAQKKYADVG